MKLYSYYSDDFADLAANVMLPSAIRAGFDVDVTYLGDLETDCDNKRGNWLELNRTKVDIVLRAIDAGNPFVFCDADVRFFGDVMADIMRQLDGRDIVFQCDHWDLKVPCMGFFAAWPSIETRFLFQTIRKRLTGDNSDQDLMREIVADGCAWLDWGLLPERYWTHGARMHKRWEPGDKLEPPEDIKVHHGNWVVGHDRKARLLDEVYNIVKV